MKLSLLCVPVEVAYLCEMVQYEILPAVVAEKEEEEEEDNELKLATV